MLQPIPLTSNPGVNRDSTLFEGDFYNEAQWCRFTARGLPRKMGGYLQTTSHLPEIVRGMDLFSADKLNYLHMGSASFLTQAIVNSSGVMFAQNDRTPAGFTIDPNNLWQLTTFYNKVSGLSSVVAHASPSLNDIASTTESHIYYGDVANNAPLVASAMDPISGGILALPPYLIGFGAQGRVDVSAVNDLTVATAGSAFVTAQKIVKGFSVRSGGGPAGILWSLDSIISMVFDASILTGIPFAFNELDTSISVLSEQAIVEFDSIYYWAGADRFQLFSGVTQELPNPMNGDFFYDNLNFDYRQKVFAFKVPRWGEIWWCFPFGKSSECNHAVIYNTRLRTWYDTQLPDGGRSAAIWAKVYPRPFMCDVDLNPLTSGYGLWQHETGVDKVVGSTPLPIESHFATRELSPITNPQQPVNKAFRVALVEPDFAQTGAMTCTVLGRANARVDQIELATFPISEPPAVTEEQLVETKQNARLLSFRFSSNIVGGDFTAGRNLAHIEPADGRVTQ